MQHKPCFYEENARPFPLTRPHLFALASSSKLENMDDSTDRVPGEGGPLVGSGAERACPSRNEASSRSSLGRRLRVTLRSATCIRQRLNKDM